MNEELLKELLNRIEMCQGGVLDTCNCFECPLYKHFGDGQNICLKLSEIKYEQIENKGVDCQLVMCYNNYRK